LRRTFQSTPSGGKATAIPSCCGIAPNVSIHAFRGEGDRKAIVDYGFTIVSIHAFRGEGDRDSRLWLGTWLCFNPRLPGGRRHGDCGTTVQPVGFNPRLPGGRRRSAFVLVLN